MNCNVINDLIPLYIDDCCSEESAALVAEHLKTCESCRRAYEQMHISNHTQEKSFKTVKLQRISDWKASVLQAVMLFVAFAVITAGVTLESQTPDGISNGLWAIALIIPATGFLLSLANWFFVRVYRSRSVFSNSSWIVTLAIITVGYLWAAFHYSDGILLTSPLTCCGLVLTIAFCVLSKVFSNRYAQLLGKE